MKKFRFLFLVLALILVVGMTTCLFVRKQSGGQTVMQHSAQVPVSTTPVSTTPATTGDDEPAAPDSEATVAKILLLVNHDEEHPVVVVDKGVEIDPIDTYWINGEPPAQSGAKPSYGTNYVPFDRYLVTPGASSFTVQSSPNSQQKGGGPDPSESFDVYYLSVETGKTSSDVSIGTHSSGCTDESVSIGNDIFCVIVYMGEYTFVSE